MNRPFTTFQLIAKPSGSVCNIDCSYCFYLEKEQLYPERKSHWKMDDDTLERYIRQHLAAQQAEVVDFIWQGGEPTLMGIDYFERAMSLQTRYRGNKRINNFLQTNGTRLDEEWARFLKQHNFLVGVSLDGDRRSNDAHRLTRAGSSTYDQVIKGMALLKRYEVEFNTLTVVNAENVKRPLDVYHALKRAGSRYMQFIPLVERQASVAGPDGLTLIAPDFSGQCRVTEWSVPPNAYGGFLNTIFDHWLRHDLGEVFVMNFEQTLTQLTGGIGSCVSAEKCGGNVVLEANGDLFSCDHFVYPQHKLGNIHQTDIADLVNSPQNVTFGSDKLNNISVECLTCSVRSMCHGGCPKHRFEISLNGLPNKNYFCGDYKKYFSHTLPAMNTLIELIQAGKPPSRIRRYFRTQQR